MDVVISGIGAWGPGFTDWSGLQGVFSGDDVRLDDAARPAPECIPPRERRRAPLAVKLAVEVAEQACAMAQASPAEAACVFASGMGDMDITDYMCRTLAGNTPLLSPTRFHNSVHNAPVGYWSISQTCKKAGNAVSAHAYSVPVSLLEAMAQCHTEGTAVLWVCQDIAAPGPFHDITGLRQACALAMLLQPAGNRGVAQMSASTRRFDGAWPALTDERLHDLYVHNPAARALSLLERVAQGPSGTLDLPLNPGLSLHLVLS